MKSAKLLDIAVIGLGVGEQHARAYAAHSACRVRWLYDLDSAKAHSCAIALGQGQVAPSLETVLADDRVDIVSIASYDDAHFAETIAALQRGKHVFVEKPLCRTGKELDEIKRVWAENDRRALESNLVLRAAPLYRWLKSAIEGGELGEIYAFDGDYLYGRLHKIVDGWRRNVPDYSVMLGGGIHLVDLMIWLTGQRPTRVAAAGNSISTLGTGFKYDDFVAATFHFDSGLIGRITTNFGCMHRHQHVIRIFGTKGAFIYDDSGARLHLSRDPESRPRVLELAPLPASKGDLIPGFVDAVLGRDAQAEMAQRNFDVISICAAADAARKNNEKLQITYV